MTTADKKRIQGYVAGAIFVIGAVMVFVHDIKYDGIDMWALIPIAGAALLAVGLFIARPIFSAVGSGLYTISGIYMIFLWVDLLGRVVQSDWITEADLINYCFNIAEGILSLVCWILLLIASLRTYSARKLGYGAAIVACSVFPVSIISHLCTGIPFGGFLGWNLISWITYLVPIIGALLLGMAFDKVPVGYGITSSAASLPSNLANDQVERLAQLKTLLDHQVITREEFETKKKQIIG